MMRKTEAAKLLDPKRLGTIHFPTRVYLPQLPSSQKTNNKDSKI